MVTDEFPRVEVPGLPPLPERFHLTTEGLPRTTGADEHHERLLSLMTQARSDVLLRGWNPADCTVELEIPQYDADLFERNEYRVIATVTRRPPVLSPTTPREEALMSEQPAEKETHVEETREETTTETPAPAPAESGESE